MSDAWLRRGVMLAIVLLVLHAVVPMVVFTALPLASRLWTLIAMDQSWWTRTVEFAPLLIGFAAPLLLLLMAYLELSRRGLPASAPSA